MTYIDRIGETEAVDRIAEVEGVEAAIRAVATIVRDAMGGAGDLDDLSAALSWVRDGSIGVGSKAVKAGVRACVPSYLTPILVEALVAPIYVVRSQAIYTFGKMGFREDLPVLLNAFDRYLDRDPLLTPKLIGEISWLGGESSALHARVRSHPHYLTRWSFFGTEAACPGLTGTEKLRAACAEFDEDQAMVVRAEAQHVLAEIRMLEEFAKDGLRHDRASRRKRKRRRVEHNAAAPLLFNGMHMRFLHSCSGLDYDVGTLDAFVRSLTTPS